MEHATQYPEEYSKVASVQKKVRGYAAAAGEAGGVAMEAGTWPTTRNAFGKEGHAARQPEAAGRSCGRRAMPCGGQLLGPHMGAKCGQQGVGNPRQALGKGMGDTGWWRCGTVVGRNPTIKGRGPKRLPVCGALHMLLELSRHEVGWCVCVFCVVCVTSRWMR